MEAMWTRFFPAIEKTREILRQGIIGDLTLMNCTFGFKNTLTERLHQKALGGGAVLDIGVYPISFAEMIFGGGPRNIHVTGELTSQGVDEHFVVTMGYKPNQLVMCACSFHSDMASELIIYGTNGNIKISAPFWCPTSITVTTNGKQENLTWELPETQRKLNFINSSGLRFEIQHVHQLLNQQKIESEIMPLNESLIIMKTLDELRRQLGVSYPME